MQPKAIMGHRRECLHLHAALQSAVGMRGSERGSRGGGGDLGLSEWRKGRLGSSIPGCGLVGCVSVELPGSLPEVGDGQADARILPFLLCRMEVEREFEGSASRSEWGMMQLQIPDASGLLRLLYLAKPTFLVCKRHRPS